MRDQNKDALFLINASKCKAGQNALPEQRLGAARRDDSVDVCQRPTARQDDLADDDGPLSYLGTVGEDTCDGRAISVSLREVASGTKHTKEPARNHEVSGEPSVDSKEDDADAIYDYARPK